MVGVRVGGAPRYLVVPNYFARHIHPHLSCFYQNEIAQDDNSLLSNHRLCVHPPLITLLLEWETSMQALYYQDVTMLAIDKSLYLWCCS
jgi:hypothetical protein